jgi:hypothetical protein
LPPTACRFSVDRLSVKIAGAEPLLPPVKVTSLIATAWQQVVVRNRDHLRRRAAQRAVERGEAMD